MGVFHRYFGVGDGKVIVTEVPEAFDAQIYKTAGHLFCTFTGQTKNRHNGFMAGAEVLKLVNVMDGNAVQILAHHILLGVKHSQQVVAIGVGGQKAGYGGAQSTSTNQNGGEFFSIAKQQATNLVQKDIHVVADALLTKATKAVKVLSNLAGGGTHHAGQFAGGNLGHPIGLHLTDIAIIFGQPFDYRKRNLVLCMIHRSVTIFE